MFYKGLYSQRGKRLFDVCFSTLVLILGLPVYLLIALLIKCTSYGPIFFVDRRLGKNFKIIRLYKFRTMYCDAEKKLSELLDTNPKLRMEWNMHCKLRSDPRITPLGRILRKTSCDELPQFLNVFLGDLSVVGPRPFAIDTRSFLGKKAKKILSVKPGLTGIWQISGRSLLPLQKRLLLDERYVESHGFLSDLGIILKTIPVMIFPKGAF